MAAGARLGVAGCIRRCKWRAKGLRALGPRRLLQRWALLGMSRTGPNVSLSVAGLIQFANADRLLQFGSKPAPSTSDSRIGQPQEHVAVDGNTRLDVPSGRTPESPMWIHVKPGDFTGAGGIGSVQLISDGPRWNGFEPSGRPRDVSVTGATAKPLEIKFAAGAPHAEAIPVIWRKDSQAGWYPVAVGDKGGVGRQRTQV